MEPAVDLAPSLAIGQVLDVCERSACALQLAAARTREPALRMLFARRAGEHERAIVALQGLMPRLDSAPAPAEQAQMTSVEPTDSSGRSQTVPIVPGCQFGNDLALLETWKTLELLVVDTLEHAMQAAPMRPVCAYLKLQRDAAAANLAQVRAIVRVAVKRQRDDVRRNRAHVHGLREQVRLRTRHA